MEKYRRKKKRPGKFGLTVICPGTSVSKREQAETESTTGEKKNMDLRIGICDDAPDWREKNERNCETCTDQMANSVEIYSFQNGNELLSEEHPPMHILFMDIEMSE